MQKYEFFLRSQLTEEREKSNSLQKQLNSLKRDLENQTSDLKFQLTQQVCKAEELTQSLQGKKPLSDDESISMRANLSLLLLQKAQNESKIKSLQSCLLYTSDAADE